MPAYVPSPLVSQISMQNKPNSVGCDLDGKGSGLLINSGWTKRKELKKQGALKPQQINDWSFPDFLSMKCWY